MSLVIIAEYFCNSLIFTYKDTKYLRDYQLFYLYSYPELAYRCLKSLTNQTLEDIDIIIVDDGSTDDSYSICQKYAIDDERIQLVHKDNGGLSSARNFGLNYVKSEYVAFVDSDDYVAPKMFEILYATLKSDCLDTVFCGFYSQNHDGRFVEKKEVNEYMCFNGPEDVKTFLMSMIGSEPSYKHTARFFMTVWRALYSVRIIKDNGLQFRDFISEDLIFHCDYLTKASKVGLIPECFYYYCWNGNSLSNTFNRFRFKRDIEVYNELHSYLNDQELQIYKSYLDKYLLLRVRIDIAAVCNAAFHYSEKRKCIAEMINTKELQDIFCSYPYTQLRLPIRLMFLLMKNGLYGLLYLFMAVMKILK